MKHTSKIKLALAVTTALGAQPVFADVEELEAFTTVAHSYRTLLSQTGSTVEVITREDLERGQSTFVLDALRELPGVYVRNNGGPGNSFGITTRGLTVPPVVLIDGIEVSNPASGTVINPGVLFTGAVERVEFLKGSQSSLYGADALSGVMSLTTRQAEQDTTSGFLTAAYGSFDTWQAGAGVQGDQGPFGYSITVGHQSSDGFSAADNNDESDGYENNSVTAKVGYELTETLDVYAVAYYIDSEADFDNNGFDSTFGLSLNEQIFAKVGAQLEVNDMWQSEANFAYSEVDSRSLSNFGAVSEFVSKGERNDVQWHNVVTVNEAWTVAAGVEYEKEINQVTDDERDEWSVYVENTLAVTDALDVSLGGRIDDNSAYGNNSTWRTTGSYQIEALSARLHGSYGTSFIAPTFFETSSPLYGNPDLSPEEGKGWDLGIEFLFAENSLLLDVTYFDNTIKNQIEFLTLSFSPFTGTYINNAQYESDGVEISLAWQATDSVTFGANYTHTDAENGNGSEPLHVAENMLNANINWTGLDERLDVKVSGRYIDERATFAGTVDASTVLDVAAQYEIDETATVWTSVNNVFDEDYQEIAGFNSPDFNITAGVRLTF